MAMLLLLCLSAASLLTVSMRVAQAGVSAAKAKMNAVAAGRIAIAELQRLAGPDRRITANGSIVDKTGTATDSPAAHRPKLVGVWKGLSATPGKPAGWSRSNLPAVSPVHTGAGAYENDHNDAFLGWLASGNTGSGAAAKPLVNAGADSGYAGLDWMTSDAAKPDPRADWLLLSANGKNGYAAGFPAFRSRDDGDLYATPESFPADRAGDIAGAFAWTVMDENQKARVDLRENASGDAGERALFAASSARRFHPAHAGDGTEKWNSQSSKNTRPPPGGWSSLPLDTLDAGWFPIEPGTAATPAPALRHDFTTESVSLLTDVANGGLKRDLNMPALMSETDFDAIPGIGGATGYLGFESKDNRSSTGRHAWWRTDKTNTLVHPDDAPASLADRQFRPIWSDVREWSSLATTAKALDNTRAGNPALYVLNGAPTIRQISTATDSGKYLPLFGSVGFDRKYQSAWRQPVLYRYRIELALYAEPDAPAATTYTILPKANIIVQLWNPYNVDMELDPADTLATSAWGLPFKIAMTGKDAAGKALTRNMTFIAWYPNTGTANDALVRQYPMSSTMNFKGILKAGAIQTYSVMANASAGGSSVPLQLGYYPGHYKPFDKIVVNHYVTSGFDGKSPLSRVQLVLRTDTDNYKPPLFIYSPKLFSVPMKSGTRTGTEQNPSLILLNGSTSAPSPLQLTTAQSDKPLVIFENRLKAEAFSGGKLSYKSAVGGADNRVDTERFNTGEPQGILSRFYLNDGRKSTWLTAPYESVVWAVDELNDSESKYPMEVDGAAGENGFGGTGYSSTTGLDSFVYHHIPLHPPIGLLSLRHARLGGGIRPVMAGSENTNNGIYNIHDAFGNSLITPYVATDAVIGKPSDQTNAGGPAFTPCDMSWITNAAVADSWFSSSLGAWDKGACATLFPFAAKDAGTMYTDFLSGKSRLPDGRFIADNTPDTKFITGDTARPESYKKIARHLLVEGGFNLNSTSVRAWRAFLASTHADTGAGTSKTGLLKNTSGGIVLDPKTDDTTTVATNDVVNEKLTDNPGADAAGRVNGGRILSDAELDRLAAAMVSEVKKRGPFLSVGEFLNRRLETGNNGLKGAAQEAIDTAGLNDHLRDTGRPLTPPALTPNTDIGKVYTASGVNQPGWLSQADLLAPLSSAMTARGDTFVIRVSASSGDAADARATMEITVRRTYAHLDTADADETELLALTKPANRAFGRRFVVVATRWLTDGEI